MIAKQGKYRAQVISVADEEKRGRLFVQTQFLEEPVWAEPCFPFGGGEDYGCFWTPEEGSVVWVEVEGSEDGFEQDLGKLIWSGTSTGRPGNFSEIPHNFQGNAALGGKVTLDVIEYADADDANAVDGVVTVVSPDSAYKSTYPNSRGWKTPRGMIFEYDDTPDNERIFEYHIGGYSREVGPAGFMTEFSRGRWESDLGPRTTQVYGPVLESFKSDHTEVVNGKFKLLASQSVEFVVDDTLTFRSGPGIWNCGGTLNLNIDGETTLDVTSNLNISARGLAVAVTGNTTETYSGTISETIANTEIDGRAFTRVVNTGDVVQEILTSGNFHFSVAGKGDIIMSPGLLSAVKLGTPLAAEPAMCGNLTLAALNQIITLLTTFFATPLGLTTAPGNPIGPAPGSPAVIAGLLALQLSALSPNPVTNVLSQNVMVDKGLVPSAPALLG